MSWCEKKCFSVFFLGGVVTGTVYGPDASPVVTTRFGGYGTLRPTALRPDGRLQPCPGPRPRRPRLPALLRAGQRAVRPVRRQHCGQQHRRHDNHAERRGRAGGGTGRFAVTLSLSIYWSICWHPFPVDLLTPFRGLERQEWKRGPQWIKRAAHGLGGLTADQNYGVHRSRVLRSTGWSSDATGFSACDDGSQNGDET